MILSAAAEKKPIGELLRVDGPKAESAEPLSREGKALATEVETQASNDTRGSPTSLFGNEQ
jgi:hypothetical protein